jgi:hypothetical protein
MRSFLVTGTVISFFPEFIIPWIPQSEAHQNEKPNTTKKNANDEINEFVALEYSTDQLIYYNVLDFSLTNKPATVDVFPEFFVDPFPIKNLFCAILNGK